MDADRGSHGGARACLFRRPRSSPRLTCRAERLRRRFHRLNAPFASPARHGAGAPPVSAPTVSRTCAKSIVAMTQLVQFRHWRCIPMKGMALFVAGLGIFFWQAPFRPLVQIGSAKYVPIRGRAFMRNGSPLALPYWPPPTLLRSNIRRRPSQRATVDAGNVPATDVRREKAALTGACRPTRQRSFRPQPEQPRIDDRATAQADSPAMPAI
jgi:hypothetical protein